MKLHTTELDFDGIKQSLKTFLQGQEAFSDYNFEGSGMSVLLDILAYNTHYNSLYLNLALNESFIDTASKRSSVVSKAKELGYTPKSAICSTAVVNITIINELIDAPSYIEIPAFTVLTSTTDSQTFNFYTTQSYIAYRSSNQYVFNNVILKEGSLYQYSYEYVEGGSYVIPNNNVDITTLEVIVQPNASSSVTDVYKNSNTIINIDGKSLVYFIKENYDGLYELEFGNNDIGKKLDVGNYITVRYLISSLEVPNGINSFSFNYPNSFVATVDSAFGGSQPEDIESIRWNAPRHFTSQNRCVTSSDYINMIKSLYNVKDVNVWGGESMSPAQYGKVFISVVPKNNPFLSEDEKDYILEYIVNPRKSLTITPEFIDPAYINIELDVKFYYNPNLTTRSSGDLSSLVIQTIEDYNEKNLSLFSGVFKYSRLTADIDNTDSSITSNIMNIKLHREITPIFNIDSSYIVNLGNAIKNSVNFEEAVISSGFYIKDNSNICYIEDVPPNIGDIGKLRLFYRDVVNNKIYLRDCGSIDYSKGLIKIDNITIRSLFSSEFKLIITPATNDVVSNQNQFVQIDFSKVSITPIIDVRKGM